MLSASAASAAPNVLLIIADDIGPESIGAYGGATVRPTPTIDAIAAQGVVFTQIWANPLCATSRATMQTGRYSWRTNVLNATASLPTEETTIPAVLGGNPALGYTSAVVGKWGLGGSVGNSPSQPSNPHAVLAGYDFFAGRPGARVGTGDYESYTNWIRNEARFDASLCSPPVHAGACVVAEPTELLTGTANYATVVNVDDAIAWLESVPSGAPWFLVLSFNAPHDPFEAPPDGLLSAPVEPGTCPPTETSPDGTLDLCRGAMVEAMDHEIARLLEDSVLQDPATRANTTIFFVGDNGSLGKFTVFQGGVKVPLIASGYGVVGPPRTSEALVNTSDLFLTILRLAGASAASFPTTVGSLPWEHDSFDLGPILRDELDEIRHFAYAEVMRQGFATNAKAIRNRAGYKLVYEPDFEGWAEGPGPWYFYSLSTDPGEEQSLVDAVTGELLVPNAALDAILDDLRARLGDPGQPPNLAAANDDGDADGVATDGGPAPCTGGAFLGCDDNCPDVPNPSQADADSDGLGDVCDAACGNGVDDDGDGGTDYPADVGCSSATAATESPRCQDGIDNDGDLRVDYDGGVSIHGACSGGTCPPGVSDWNDDGVADKDLHCVSFEDNIEAAPGGGGGCGLGAELALLVPLLARLRRLRTAA
jgi:arylsulfatase A-like enzyme